MTKVIAIGAGHGYNTPGKRTPDGEREWSFNNKVVGAAIDYLKKYEDVKIVRLDDPSGKRDVPLSERTDKANQANADVLVSYHHNANTGNWGTWGGTETYTYVGNWKGAEALAKEVHNRVVKAMGLRDRGLKKANFHMLRESKMSAILVEGGFMDSKTDIKKMRDDNVLKKVGQAVAEGIADHLNLKKKPEPKPKPKSNVFYRVVTGSFNDKENAEQRVAELKKKGFDSFIDVYKK